MRLLPEDYQFIELIQKEVSEFSSIPLEIKPDRVNSIITDAAKYFYEWHPQAIERKHFLILANDIIKARENGMQSVMKLPDPIKFVFRTRRSNGYSSLSSAAYLSSPLLSLNRFNGGGASVGGGSGFGNFGSQRDMVSTTLALYEYQTLNSLSNNNRGISHSFSELTHQITFLSDVDNDVVLECGVRIPVSDMYGDLWFKQYVVGKSLESLGRIVGTYDHRYVGGVTINWSEWKSDGKEMVEKVEEMLKTFNSNNFIITK